MKLYFFKVKVANDGQMTVHKQKFLDYAQQNSQKEIGKAMKKCYDSPDNGDDMYKEVRAICAALI